MLYALGRKVRAGNQGDLALQNIHSMVRRINNFLQLKKTFCPFLELNHVLRKTLHENSQKQKKTQIQFEG